MVKMPLDVLYGWDYGKVPFATSEPPDSTNTGDNHKNNYTLRILIVGYSRLRIVLDNNVSDNSFIIGNISRHYRQNRIIGRRLRGGAFLQAVTRNFLVT